MARVALVTGGIRGIGAAVCIALKAAGCTVAANYHGNDADAQAFSKKHGIAVFKFDVASFDASQKGVKDVEGKVGAIDILVNNAGITRDGFLHKMTVEQWDDVVKTNLYSIFNMSHAVIEGMRARGWGRIINIASINGQSGQLGQTNYSAAKAGIFGFTKSLALESAAKGITVNAVAPGYVDTAMVRAVPKDVLDAVIGRIPMKRLGTPEEIGAAVRYLASDEAAFMTGATLTINGGMYMAA